MSLEVFQNYFKEIKSKYLINDFTEITLRSPFENFITNLDKDYGLIHEPKRVKKVGAPDFKAFRKAIKIGYIETKDLGVNLDNELDSDQLKRYKASVNNIILTNYHHFVGFHCFRIFSCVYGLVFQILMVSYQNIVVLRVANIRA